ncbi:DUF417 family protein [Sabulicella glaciei]|uniref:YkgB family protein n=1 Tax=Sabulicella glaciei TaxID=2984948 RepID=A0ABT3NZR4_9PROT|nr:DUF417 family protein [Roseococcus sp. MDT2-1-1]MCW8087590.1 YkgB family protein [Roseococcus sp. MDT2-1-1]
MQSVVAGPVGREGESGIEQWGATLLRLTMVLIFLSFGMQKFTAYEAAAIEPFLVHFPLLRWLHDLLGRQGASNLIGSVELLAGLGLAVGFFARGSLPSLLGAAISVVTYLVTLSFLLTTPGVIVWQEGLPLSSPYPGQFLMKDMVLLAASVFLLGQALSARRDMLRRES